MKDTFIPVENDFVINIAPKQGISLYKFASFPVKVSLSLQVLPEMVRDTETQRYPSLLYRLDNGDVVRAYTSDLVNAKSKCKLQTYLEEGESNGIEGTFIVTGVEPLKRDGMIVYPNNCYKEYDTFAKDTDGMERYSPAYKAAKAILLKGGLFPNMVKDHYNCLIVDRPLVAVLNANGERKYPIMEISEPTAKPRKPKAVK